MQEIQEEEEEKMMIMKKPIPLEKSVASSKKPTMFTLRHLLVNYTYIVSGLVLVIDLSERHNTRGKEMSELGKVDTIA